MDLWVALRHKLKNIFGSIAFVWLISCKGKHHHETLPSEPDDDYPQPKATSEFPTIDKGRDDDGRGLSTSFGNLSPPVEHEKPRCRPIGDSFDLGLAKDVGESLLVSKKIFVPMTRKNDQAVVVMFDTDLKNAEYIEMPAVPAEADAPKLRVRVTNDNKIEVIAAQFTNKRQTQTAPQTNGKKKKNQDLFGSELQFFSLGEFEGGSFKKKLSLRWALSGLTSFLPEYDYLFVNSEGVLLSQDEKKRTLDLVVSKMDSKGLTEVSRLPQEAQEIEWLNLGLTHTKNKDQFVAVWTNVLEEKANKASSARLMYDDKSAETADLSARYIQKKVPFFWTFDLQGLSPSRPKRLELFSAAGEVLQIGFWWAGESASGFPLSLKAFEPKGLLIQTEKKPNLSYGLLYAAFDPVGTAAPPSFVPIELPQLAMSPVNAIGDFLHYTNNSDASFIFFKSTWSREPSLDGGAFLVFLGNGISLFYRPTELFQVFCATAENQGK